MTESEPPVCAFCKRIIVRSQPEKKGSDQFCNALCLTGFEAENKAPVPYASSR